LVELRHIADVAAVSVTWRSTMKIRFWSKICISWRDIKLWS